MKGFISDGGHMGGTPQGSGLPFWVAVVAVIGFSMWGNEPDFWRFGRPTLLVAAPDVPVRRGLVPALHDGRLDDGAARRLERLGGDRSATPSTTRCSAGSGSRFIIATISQFAINDGNYYESVNAGQNLVGGWRQWRRIYTCVLVAGGGVIAADLVNFHFINGWFKVASFLAVTVPSATVIMAVDHFLLPRLFRISRPLDEGAVVGGGRDAQLAGDRSRCSSPCSSA